MNRRAFLFGTAALAATTAEAVEIHFAPVENLERIDVALIDAAERSIDLAAFVLTSWPVIDALNRAAARGVEVRVVLDKSQSADRLAGPAVRVWTRRPLMHLKTMVIDGQRLRTGSANFSASGLKSQANDLLVIDEPAMVRRAEENFTRLWAESRQPSPPLTAPRSPPF